MHSHRLNDEIHGDSDTVYKYSFHFKKGLGIEN